jgi:Domain of unknown function (DUF4902)
MDYYQRISAKRLAQLSWMHLDSYIEGGELRQFRRGSTEWQALSNGAVLSLSWDWRQCDDGAIRADVGMGLCTNIVLLDEKGYDALPGQTEAVFWEMIQGLRWTAFIASLH